MGVRTAPTIQASLVSAYAIWSSAPFGYERLPFANAFEVPGEVLRPEHVALHPYSEALAVARDGIPILVEEAVVRVVVVGIRRVSAAGDDGDRVHGHVRDD